MQIQPSIGNLANVAFKPHPSKTAVKLVHIHVNHPGHLLRP